MNKSSFEFDGEKYKFASRHQKEWGNKIISELELRGDESILDLGCGDGVLTAQLASRVPNGKVLGIDSSESMLSSAEKLKSDNLSFELMDINNVDFREEFDVVFSNATLHWIKDHKRLLKNLYNALRPGGFIRLNFAGAGNCQNFEDIVRALMINKEFAVYFKNFSWPWYTPRLGEYEALIKDSSFKDVRIWGEIVDRYFIDTQEMIRWLDQPSLIPFLACIEAEDKQRFRGAVIDGMIEEAMQEDGRCFVPFRRINVYARK